MLVKEIGATELASWLQAGYDVLLLDIRSDAEVAQGIIPGSEHLAMHLIPLKLQNLPSDRDIVLYCRSGARSYHACNFLQQKGVGNVLNLRGGIIGWAHQGYEIAVSR